MKISETDVAIDQIQFGSRHGKAPRYSLAARTEATRRVIPMGRYADNEREAQELRAEIIDGLAGSARVGDVVRIGRGAAEYRVDGFSDGDALLYPTVILTPAQSRVRRLPCERLHVVRAER